MTWHAPVVPCLSPACPHTRQDCPDPNWDHAPHDWNGPVGSYHCQGRPRLEQAA